MAAIDKIYVTTYDELSELRVWALAYYPKLITYFYDWALTASYKEFQEVKEEAARAVEQGYKSDWRRISANGTLSCAIAYIKREWGWDDEEEITKKAIDIRTRAHKSIEKIRQEVKLPITNTPSKVDRKLKWICPMPCVRVYLQTQCGVKEHWWYRLFWRGKREFHYYF